MSEPPTRLHLIFRQRLLALAWSTGGRFANGQSRVVGTPDDCIAGIARLQDASGGFGGLLLRAEDWAPRDKLHRSYELMARYVMPQFQGSLTGIVASNQRSASMKEALQANRRAGLRRATESYLAGRQ